MSFCYKKILGVFTHLRVTTPNIIEPDKPIRQFVSAFFTKKTVVRNVQKTRIQ